VHKDFRAVDNILPCAVFQPKNGAKEIAAGLYDDLQHKTCVQVKICPERDWSSHDF
jgi:hypothetical protein